MALCAFDRFLRQHSDQTVVLHHRDVGPKTTFSHRLTLKIGVGPYSWVILYMMLTIVTFFLHIHILLQFVFVIAAYLFKKNTELIVWIVQISVFCREFCCSLCCSQVWTWGPRERHSGFNDPGTRPPGGRTLCAPHMGKQQALPPSALQTCPSGWVTAFLCSQLIKAWLRTARHIRPWQCGDVIWDWNWNANMARRNTQGVCPPGWSLLWGEGHHLSVSPRGSGLRLRAESTVCVANI